MTLPNVKDLTRSSSASDDSVYFLWTSWSIWLSAEKSNNKPVTRNAHRDNSCCNISRTLQIRKCVDGSFTRKHILPQLAIKWFKPFTPGLTLDSDASLDSMTCNKARRDYTSWCLISAGCGNTYRSALAAARNRFHFSRKIDFNPSCVQFI